MIEILTSSLQAKLDMELVRDFQEAAQRVRTVGESAHLEVLSRLLRLNHERWEEEQRMNDEGKAEEDCAEEEVRG